MSLRQVRRRCEQTLKDVDVPVPFDGNVFRDVVARRRGRPIRLVAKATGVGPCGVWLSLPESDYVFYEASTSPVHRDHIIAHELGHLLCDHVSHETIPDEVLLSLMPDLDIEVVRRVLARTTYSASEEQEAEMIATLVLERSGHPPGPDSTGGDIVLDRLQRTLGARRG